MDMSMGAFVGARCWISEKRAEWPIPVGAAKPRVLRIQEKARWFAGKAIREGRSTQTRASRFAMTNRATTMSNGERSDLPGYLGRNVVDLLQQCQRCLREV
jgi:hypothetical protein